MWLDPTGLEQATSEPVARHKAQRFSDGIVVDLCAGIGGDTVALAERAHVLAVDIDFGMCRRCRWNAQAYDVAQNVAVVRSCAEPFPLPPQARVHIDPDRRARPGKPRAKRIEGYAPGVRFLLALPSRCAGGAIKLGPASNFEELFSASSFEIELVSLGGECKEATMWFGDLATCRRRATCLPKAATFTDRDAPASKGDDGAPPVFRQFVFEPDAALMRARLLDAFAHVHGLARIPGGADLLTGPDPVHSPFLTTFELIEILPLDLKRLRRQLVDRRLSPVEIKLRGLDLDPARLRKLLRTAAPDRAALLLVGGRGPGYAIIARRLGG
jgi:hypothetical protein